MTEFEYFPPHETIAELCIEVEWLRAENEQLRALLQKCRPYIASTSKALAGLIETALEPKP